MVERPYNASQEATGKSPVLVKPSRRENCPRGVPLYDIMKPNADSGLELRAWRAFAESFVAPDRRARWLAQITNARGRAKLRSALYHFSHELDPRYARTLPKEADTPQDTVALLVAIGAPEECIVLSANDEQHGAQVNLRDAVLAIFPGEDGTIISCIPGKLAYVETEDGRFLCAR